MKIERFLYWINGKLLHTPDIHFKAVKMFIDKFDSCLSPTETKRFGITIEMIKEFTLKQISLDVFADKARLEVLETEFDNLNNKVKKPEWIPK